MWFLFASTVFLSAGLLFVVEPLAAKMLLPLLGGSPAVWNTCMVFYQAVLLAGYAYAHWLTSQLRPRRQVLVHGGLLLLACLALPVNLSTGSPPSEANPLPWLLRRLTLGVGLPIFTLAASAPLLQRWLAGISHKPAPNPYGLYSASNLGSLLALPCYPLLLERFFPLGPDQWLSQSRLWTAGFWLFMLLTAGCAWVVWRNPSTAPAADQTGCAASFSRLSRLRWVVLAFVPSSLMLGVTTYITIDLAAIPMFWVLPLGMYLLSFVLVFGSWPARLHAVVVRLVPFAVATLLVLLLGKVEMPAVAGLSPAVIGIGLHLVALFLVSLACHGELARTRPPARHLTGFYLWLAVGGVLGGMFNALLAPLVFNSVAEYPLALVLACFLLPPAHRPGWLRRVFGSIGILVDLALALLVGAAALWLSHLVIEPAAEASWLVDLYHRLAATLGPSLALVLLAFGPLVVACCIWPIRPIRLGFCIGALALAAAAHEGRSDMRVVERTRDFFGVLEVDCDSKGKTWSLWHGTTLHGREMRQSGRRSQPLTYYHTTGPAGQVFRTLPQARAPRVALVGLGAGCLAAYGRPGQHFTFYEIDPAVRCAAERYFSFLHDSRASCDVVLGDARLRLAEAPDGQFGLIVLDAFSSDAVPMHLITREAFELYFRKLTPDGVILVNMTNRYLDLRPVLGNLAQHLKIVGRCRDDGAAGFPGKSPATWAVLARRSQDVNALPTTAEWQTECGLLTLSGHTLGPASAAAELFARLSGSWEPLPLSSRVGVWRDDFSNLWSAFR